MARLSCRHYTHLLAESHVKGLVESINEKIMPPAQREAKQVPEGSRQRTDTIQKNAGRAAVVLVVIEDALADFRVARLHPPVKPLNGCGTRRIGVPPIEAEVFGQGLNGMVASGPFGLRAHHIIVKVYGSGLIKHGLDFFLSADFGMPLAELSPVGTLIG